MIFDHVFGENELGGVRGLNFARKKQTFSFPRMLSALSNASNGKIFTFRLCETSKRQKI